jgi:hypothetical protein
VEDIDLEEGFDIKDARLQRRVRYWVDLVRGGSDGGGAVVLWKNEGRLYPVDLESTAKFLVAAEYGYKTILAFVLSCDREMMLQLRKHFEGKAHIDGSHRVKNLFGRN